MSTARPPKDFKELAAAVGAVVVLVGGGGGAGYYFKSTAEAAPVPPPQSLPLERVVALETWRATQEATAARDAQERARLADALRDVSTTNSALRDVVLVMTERLGAIDTRVKEGFGAMDVRVRTLEQRPRR